MSPTPHQDDQPVDDGIPVIDIAPLLGRVDGSNDSQSAEVAAMVDRACRDAGFFGIVGHGVDPELQTVLDVASRAFFDLPDTDKTQIAMARAGSAWRGWFPVEGELTSGRPDRKEGIYVGSEHGPSHPRVVAGTPLHGANLFPAQVPELGPAVLAWMAALRPVADAVMRAIALGLGMPATWFEDHLTADPTILFRIFHYPPSSIRNLVGNVAATNADHQISGSGTEMAGADESWGVGEHTDYGLLTLLAQDHHGGLQVRRLDGSWIDVPPTPGVLVCNIGDMLDRLTGGRYRSTPHRVRNVSGESRLSFPYFFDPSWNATVPRLPIADDEPRSPGAERWDGADVTAWEGTYGDYLTAKVSKVFPDLFAASTGESDR